ncbi:MAG: cell division protein FtsH [Fimbriiglobus sp.]
MPEEAAPTFDRSTAFHEAGHAVVALALDRPVHKVTILPKAERLGACEFRKGVQRPSDDWIENSILIALAGMVSEARVTGQYCLRGASQDLATVRKLALLRASDRAVERLERRMLSKTENMLNDDALWRAVELIAEELLKLGHISGRAARHFYEQALKEFE